MENKRNELSTQGDSSMSEQSLYCLGIHFKFLYEQGINKKPFNPVEPCLNCRYGVNGSRECNLSVDWRKMVTQLAETTGIHINYFVSDNIGQATFDRLLEIAKNLGCTIYELSDGMAICINEERARCGLEPLPSPCDKIFVRMLEI